MVAGRFLCCEALQYQHGSARVCVDIDVYIFCTWQGKSSYRALLGLLT